MRNVFTKTVGDFIKSYMAVRIFSRGPPGVTYSKSVGYPVHISVQLFFTVGTNHPFKSSDTPFFRLFQTMLTKDLPSDRVKKENEAR